MIAVVDVRIVLDIPESKKENVIRQHVDDAISRVDCIDMATLQIAVPEIGKTFVED